MTWSYSGDPTTSPKDEVRFLLGDTDIDFPILQDEEINYLLANNNNTAINAAIAGCDAQLAHFAKLVTYTAGREKVAASDRLNAFKTLRRQLESQVYDNSAMPMGSPLDPALPEASFDIGMMDNHHRY